MNEEESSIEGENDEDEEDEENESNENNEKGDEQEDSDVSVGENDANEEEEVDALCTFLAARLPLALLLLLSKLTWGIIISNRLSTLPFI